MRELGRSLGLQPEHLRDGISASIEERRSAVQGGPEQEARAWFDMIATERKRGSLRNVAEEDFIIFDKLRATLADPANLGRPQREALDRRGP